MSIARPFCANASATPVSDFSKPRFALSSASIELISLSVMAAATSSTVVLLLLRAEMKP
jgi:hypothetical protein